MALISSIQHKEQCIQVAFSGSLVYENALEGRNLLESILRDKPLELAIDLRGVNRIGSDWIAVFVWARQQLLTWQGALRLCQCSPVIYSMLSSCEVHELLNAEIADNGLSVSPKRLETQMGKLVQLLVEKGLITDHEATQLIEH